MGTSLIRRAVLGTAATFLAAGVTVVGAGTASASDDWGHGRDHCSKGHHGGYGNYGNYGYRGHRGHNDDHKGYGGYRGHRDNHKGYGGYRGHNDDYKGYGGYGGHRKHEGRDITVIGLFNNSDD